MKKFILVFLLLLAFPATAHAGLFDFVVLAVAVWFLGPTAFGWTAGQTAFTIAVMAYGQYKTMELARQQEEAQRRALESYNASLKDRTITNVATDTPHVTIYGLARVGSAIVAIFSSGARDEYQHLICIHAAHECDAIEEVYIAGKALGTLDGNGFPTSGDYLNSSTQYKTESTSGITYDLTYTPNTGTLIVSTIDTDGNQTQWPYTSIGNTVTVTGPSQAYTNSYYYTATNPSVRIRKHLGSPTDAADTQLMSEVGAKWDAARVLRGYCYTYVRLDLNQQEFQGGIPAIEMLIKGKPILDPRTSTTVWSENPALVLYDYLRGENCGIPSTDIPSADVITAANACDELITVGTLSNVPRYTFNGTVSSDQDQTKIIGQIAQSMSGGINATTWEMWAGKYIAPVLTIEQADIVGAIGINPGLSDADILNGVTARFISAENNYVATDIKPYQNATYRAADGKDLFASMEFPFTDKTQRIHNLARIYVEDQRNSFTVKGTFSLKAWDVKIGQRIQFNAVFFGFTNKIFRVVAKSYSYNGTVELTLKEDAASIWDLADAVVLDSTPNSDLPNPFFIDTPGAPTVTEELYETSGSSGVKSRVLVEWTANESIRVTGYVVEHKSITDTEWTVLPLTATNKILINDFQLGLHEFRLKAINSYFSVASQYSQVTRKEILGLTAQPSNVTNFNVIAISGRALGSWDLTGDLDVRIGGRVIIRHTPETSGGSWESSIILEEFNGNAANGNLPLLTGTYFAKFKDSSGNYSATAASFLATEALVTGYTTTHTLAEHPSFTGSKTDLVAIDNLLKLNGVSLIDDMTSLIDDWSEIDTLGGIKPLGTYLFSTYMDFGSVVQRKVDINIQTLSYDSSDLIDLWGFIDSVNAIDGAVINDTDATLYYRTTNDDPAGTPTYGAWAQFIVADVICRALQYKLELTSGNPTHQIEVSSLTARAREAV